MGKYDHLLDMERPRDTSRTPMSMHNRAAQFAPFDALTGFGGRIYETSRLTHHRIELSEEGRQEINRLLRVVQEQVKEHPVITVTYFVPDLTKEGGSYETLTEAVAKINIYDEFLLLDDATQIAFEDILTLEIHEPSSDS